MDYNLLLDLVTSLAYRLAMCGAETFRVEECVNRIMSAYAIKSEAFAIPNNLTVSIITHEGKPMTQMRRIGYHGNDLDSVERYSNLSRRICAEKPDPETAVQWLLETDAARLRYTKLQHLIGNFMSAAGFAVFFGGTLSDSLFAGICGLVVGLIGLLMDSLKANQFFRIIIASFLMSALAYGFAAAGFADNADTVIIGTLMILVPGLLFTNAMRDIINGDTNSGMNRIIQVFLIAVAIALGTGAAWQAVAGLLGEPASVPALNYPLHIQLVACLIGCLGFSILFNIHGPGTLLCALGGLLSWTTYSLCLYFGASDLVGYFWAALLSSVFAEIMARIRKYPAITYLVVSIFPLIPGASVYFTMNYVVRGEMEAFADTGLHTISIAGLLAVGILIGSTFFRILSTLKMHRKK